jgi:hypothetical protein
MSSRTITETKNYSLDVAYMAYMIHLRLVRAVQAYRQAGRSNDRWNAGMKTVLVFVCNVQ